jgi:hypothetical protein
MPVGVKGNLPALLPLSGPLGGLKAERGRWIQIIKGIRAGWAGRFPIID